MKVIFRLLFVFVLIWILTRVGIYLLPGDPVQFLVQESLVPASSEVIRQKMNLDQSPIHRIFSFPSTVSLISQQDSWAMVKNAFFHSILLTLLSLFFTISFSILLLYLSFKSLKLKRICEILSVLIASTPLFILSPILLLLFSLRLKLFPITDSPFLPAIALSIYLSSFWYRTLSRKIASFLPESAVSGARARGLPEVKVFFLYILYPCLGSFMSFFGNQLGTLLNGSVLVEVIFKWRGLGAVLADSVSSRDYPLIELCIMLVTTLTLLSQQLGYILQKKMEPRIE